MTLVCCLEHSPCSLGLGDLDAVSPRQALGASVLSEVMDECDSQIANGTW